MKIKNNMKIKNIVSFLFVVVFAFGLIGQSFAQQSAAPASLKPDIKTSGNKVGGTNKTSADAAAEGVSTIATCILAAAGAAAAQSGAGIVFIQNSHPVTNINEASGSWKECIMDGLANVLKRTVIRSLVRSTVDWINGGFEGSPAYAANLSSSLKKTADGLLGEIINQNKNLQFLCSEFEFPIKFALNLEFREGNFQEFDYEPKCTISDVASNIEGAMEDGINYYSNTGNFFNITENGTENLYTTYFKLSDEFRKVVGEREAKKIDELNRGGGFFAFRRCSDGGKYDGSKEREYKCPITSPGTLLSEKLASATNTEVNELITADEFDEIIGAILKQIFNKILTESGVSGFSETSSDGSLVADNYINESSKDDEKNLEVFKDQMIGNSYRKERADIMLNTQNSMLKTLENAKKIIEDAIKCWESKKDGYQKNNSNGYEILSQTTIDGNISFAKTNLGFIKSQIAEVKFDIIRVENNFDKYKSISVKMKEAKTSVEINKVLNGEITEDIKFIDNISSAITKKTTLERNLNDIINGKTSYASASMEKKGGVNVSINYCQGFVDEDYSSEYQRPSGRPSVALASLTNNKQNNFIDSYDPVSALELLGSENSGGVSGTGKGESCLSNEEIKLPDNEKAIYYTEREGVCYIHKNGICKDGKFYDNDCSKEESEDTDVFLDSKKISMCLGKRIVSYSTVCAPVNN